MAEVYNQVQNSTYSLSGDVLTVTANDGYKFAVAPTAGGYDDWDNVYDDTPMTLSADGKTATHNVAGWIVIYIKGNVVEAGGATLTVNNNIAQTTVEQTDNTVVVKANTGRKFAAAPTAVGSDDYDNQLNATATLSDNDTRATFELTGWVTAELYGETVEIPPVYMINIATNLANCTSQGIPNGSFASDTPLNIVLTAIDGYIFNNAPSLRYVDDYDQDKYLQFTVSEDGKTASFTDTMSNYGLQEGSQTMLITAEAVLQSTYGSRYGSVNVYKVTDEQLTEFCSKRFAYTTDGQNLLKYDLGDFVNRIRRVFCGVGTTVPTTIRCANTDTKVSAEAVKEDTQTLDFGTVLLPLHNEDNIDFNSRIQVFLPFVGLVELNSAYVGKTIGLKYEINVVTGDGVALLTYNDTAFATYDCKPSTEIMFKTNTMSIATIGGDEFTAKYLLGLRPYILMTWNTSRNENLLNAECVRKVIGTCLGLVKFTDVTGFNNGQMTNEEWAQIEQLLAQGIFIELNN